MVGAAAVSRKLLIGILIAVLTLTFTFSVILMGLLLNTPGIYIVFKLYEIAEGKVVDSTYILSKPDIVLSLEISAIASPQFKQDLVTIHKGLYKGSNVVFIPFNKLYNIAEEWIKTYESRFGNLEKTYSGLVLRVFVYEGLTGKIIYQLYDSISYKPIDVVKGKQLMYVIHLSRNTLKALKIESSYANILTLPFSKLATEISSTRTYCVIARSLAIEISPEDLTSELPSNYFNNVGGKLYVKTPLLIAWNKYSYSATVGVSINLGRRGMVTGVYPTFTYGLILPKLKDGISPSVTLWKGSGISWGGEEYYYGASNLLGPNDKWWTWVWARPIYRIYEVFRCCPDGCTYLHDDVEHIITDILTYGTTIIGGDELGLPVSTLLNNFYEGTNKQRLYIDGTFLSDGKLDPKEYITLEQIFKHYDVCGADFELGIPVGAFAALAICKALGLPTFGTACAIAIAFTSGFQISISAQGPVLTIPGNLVNHGDDPRFTNDYNVYEVVYVRVSRYKYKEEVYYWYYSYSCYYDVPAGIYFEFI